MSSSMSALSRQTARSLKASSSTFVRAASTHTEYQPSYQPQSYSRSHTSTPPRPPRPDNSTFFTGVPNYSTELVTLQTTLRSIEQRLREDKVWPIPATIELPPYMAPVSWLPVDEMGAIIGGKQNLRRRQYREITRVLAELNKMSYFAKLAGRTDLSSIANKSISKFTAAQTVSEMQGETGNRIRGYIDKLGRAVGQGRRKTAIASVWVTPVKEAIPYLEGEAESSKSALVFGAMSQSASITAPDGTVHTLPSGPDQPNPPSPDFDPSTMGEIPMGQILINQLPLPLNFHKPQDREIILRPLRLTGLIGAYNIFALVRGGGWTGQAGAVALGLSRALTAIRPETEPILYAAGMLMRDPRMVERKKTNMLGARERRAWVKR